MSKSHEKLYTFGVDFGQYFDVSIDFVLNTLIENIGQNKAPNFFNFFHEILHTAV